MTVEHAHTYAIPALLRDSPEAHDAIARWQMNTNGEPAVTNEAEQEQTPSETAAAHHL